jgi:hypothetical protein
LVWCRECTRELLENYDEARAREEAEHARKTAEKAAQQVARYEQAVEECYAWLREAPGWTPSLKGPDRYTPEDLKQWGLPQGTVEFHSLAEAVVLCAQAFASTGASRNFRMWNPKAKTDADEVATLFKPAIRSDQSQGIYQDVLRLRVSRDMTSSITWSGSIYQAQDDRIVFHWRMAAIHSFD